MVTPSYFVNFPESLLRYCNAGVMSAITVLPVPRTERSPNKCLWKKKEGKERHRKVEEKRRKRRGQVKKRKERDGKGGRCGTRCEHPKVG